MNSTLIVLISGLVLVSCSTSASTENTGETVPSLPPSRAQIASNTENIKKPKDPDNLTSEQNVSAYDGLSTGFTSNGRPWIGASSQGEDVMVFSDFQCPYCSRTNISFRAVLKKYPGIRLVHVNMPLGFHKNAKKWAKMAHCAGKQGKFWQANDYIYGHQRVKFTASSLAQHLNIDHTRFSMCISDLSTEDHINSDIKFATSLSVRGTPTFRFRDVNYNSSSIINKIRKENRRATSGN
ncbi:MAG: thioredoxin domain-containing protein [Deltaproteobacteria bacterium]|nr:thioredoxin domain-containing protein [Deltaproteobacteria bacterium]